MDNICKMEVLVDSSPLPPTEHVYFSSTDSFNFAKVSERL